MQIPLRMEAATLSRKRPPPFKLLAPRAVSRRAGNLNAHIQYLPIDEAIDCDRARRVKLDRTAQAARSPPTEQEADIAAAVSKPLDSRGYWPCENYELAARTHVHIGPN
jgi:hypothetical protein